MQNVGFTSLEGTGLSAFYILYMYITGIIPILMSFPLSDCFWIFLPPEDTEAHRGTERGHSRQRLLAPLNVIF